MGLEIGLENGFDGERRVRKRAYAVLLVRVREGYIERWSGINL